MPKTTPTAAEQPRPDVEPIDAAPENTETRPAVPDSQPDSAPADDRDSLSVPVNDILDNVTEPSANIDHIIGEANSDEQPQKPTPEKSAPSMTGSARVDGFGRPFDAAIHVTDDAGEPVLTKSGKLKCRPGCGLGGRGNKGANREAGPRSQVGGPAGGPGAPTDAVRREHTRAAAVAAVETVGTLGRMLGGEEWAFIRDESRGIDERSAGVDAFAQYFEAKGIEDIPPGVALAIWAMAYAGPRFAAPKTRGRLKLAGAWIKTKWPFKRRNKGKHTDAARTDSRDDRKRENDAGD